MKTIKITKEKIAGGIVALSTKEAGVVNLECEEDLAVELEKTSNDNYNINLSKGMRAPFNMPELEIIIKD